MEEPLLPSSGVRGERSESHSEGRGCVRPTRIEEEGVSTLAVSWSDVPHQSVEGRCSGRGVVVVSLWCSGELGKHGIRAGDGSFHVYRGVGGVVGLLAGSCICT